jgi:type VII secretion-associated serine protease mycosin
VRDLRKVSVAAVLAMVATIGLPAAPAAADTVRQMQWYLAAVKAPQAQTTAKGDGVVVAVIDSGVDAGHPDLAGAVLPGANFDSGSTGDGRTDAEGHGTKMAGIIAARGGGEMHALGIAPRAKILPVVTPATNFGLLPRSVRWAVDHGAKVINMSMGAKGPAPAEATAAINYALAKDAVVVASVGNTEQSGDPVAYPANVPGVVAVSGVVRSGEFWEGSARGPQVAIAAPAENIVNTGARNVNKTGYAGGGATSEAAAIVSGVAALIRSRYPKLNAANVINRLIRTATDEGDPGRDDLYGFGVVDAQRAVTANVPEVATNPLGSAPGGPASAGGADPGGQAQRPSGSGDGQPLGSPWARLAVVLGIGLLVVLAVVLVVVLVARRPRPAAAIGHPPPGVPGHPSARGYPPSGYPRGGSPGPPPTGSGYPSPGYPVAQGNPPPHPVYPPPNRVHPPQGGYPPPPPRGEGGQQPPHR